MGQSWTLPYCDLLSYKLRTFLEESTMRTITKFAGPLAAIALSLSGGAAHAALMNFTLTGTVNLPPDSGNLFNLNDGDTVSVVGSFDGSVLTSGTGTVLFDKLNPGNTFKVTAGDFSFTEMNDIDYTTGGTPSLTLTSGSLPGFDFVADIGVLGFFNSQGGVFNGDDDEFGIIAGTWTRFEMTVVPVPAAVWLFGSGLLGLVGIARRKAA
jgi:hypothetical protein